MTHPSEADLALFAGNDLSRWRQWRLARHVNACEYCQRVAEQYRTAQQTLGEFAADLPDGLDWDQLALEMKANIRVGLAAAECVKPARSAERPAWRLAGAITGACALLTVGWFINVPQEDTARLMQKIADARSRPVEHVVVQATIPMRDDGVRQLEAPVMSISVNKPNLLQARSVDSDSGQITITSVYNE